ncbi:AAA family ATPase [Streptomyces sp. NPDC048438]|uniref:AAA family ATPase n=1 Tax=Streptomyces sp. NPDC048438 TaxID=3365551 RepID=UPI00371D92BF
MEHPDYPEFRLKLPGDGPTAYGRVLTELGNNGSLRFLVRQGSPVSASEWPGLSEYTRRQRAELRADGSLADTPDGPGRYWTAARDIECNSASAAASLVIGYGVSGPETWRDASGHPLSDYLTPSWRAPRKSWLVRGSNVSGRDLVGRMWLSEGLVSLSGAHLPPLDEQDPTKSSLRRYVEDGYEGTASYSQKRGLVDDLHAFLTQMRVGDTLATLSEGQLLLGQITGEAQQTDSPGGLTNLRRTVSWQHQGHPYDELPEELQQKLSVQHDVVDLTSVADSLAALGAPAPVTDEEVPPAQTKELALTPVTDALTSELLIHDRAWLDEVREILWDERQLVLYGPPGTGKTYLAMKLAEHFGGGAEQVKLVQFHPSYAYEDFFEGFRPVEDPETREVAFRLSAGPLRELADLASRDGNKHIPHFLIIDEINRANLAKVFGELYFLLEYRRKTVRLTYSGDDFALPPNLFVIGTMNTADRSIALVDAAMRRRFAFIELSPRTEPTRGLLARWLEREGKDDEPAHLLDSLNDRLADPDFAIGPSYLMKPGVYRTGGLDRTWRTKILPLLSEYHYGEGIDIEDRYGLDALRKAQG